MIINLSYLNKKTSLLSKKKINKKLLKGVMIFFISWTIFGVEMMTMIFLHSLLPQIGSMLYQLINGTCNYQIENNPYLGKPSQPNPFHNSSY